jgi:pyruvate dehydrogenase E2 component (dihydrolipoamide acetyltransferase)
VDALMATNVIMPALEMAQETGKVVRWLKSPGDSVRKGEPILEIETDKVTVEIEAPASGVLGNVTAQEGDVVPVGQTIAVIAAPGEVAAAQPAAARGGAAAERASAGSAHATGARAGVSAVAPANAPVRANAAASASATAGSAPAAASAVKASPLARKIAEQHGVDIAQIKTASGRVEKADVLAYVDSLTAATPAADGAARLVAASPKARRLAAERGLDVTALRGSGPAGAVLAEDVVAAKPAAAPAPRVAEAPAAAAPGVSTVWRIMAERMTQSWTSAPHFCLVREVNASRLIAWRERAKQQVAGLTYTDLLVKLVAAAIAHHPRVNVSWKDGAIVQHPDVNVGLAVAIEDGLVVPVIHRADTLALADIAARRADLSTRAQSAKLRPADIQGGTFTISNLGMYGVDAFDAIIAPPQAAILAVGRIADRVVAVNGQPAVQPTMVLTLSCDHRALDGARGAQFLSALSELIEEPLALLF